MEHPSARADEPDPSLKDEESKAPYNEAKARAEFGGPFVDKLKERQTKFCGDWWQLGKLVRNIEHHNALILDWNNWASQEAIKRSNRQENVYVHLEGAWLCPELGLPGYNFDKIILREGHLEGAVLYFAQLRNANLYEVHLERAELLGANLEGAFLNGAHLDGASMATTCLRNANLQAARLPGASLHSADLQHSNLFVARLAGAKLNQADLSEANIRGAKTLLFDDNHVRDLNIEGNAPDPWSILRRKYTGPWFFVHLFLLAVFFAPHIGRTAYLTTISHLERWSQARLAELSHRTSTLTPAKTRTEHFIEDHFEPHRAVWLLLGDKRGLFWLLPTIIILYNVLRGYLTLCVSVLRDAEERSQRTPTIEEYYGTCHPLNQKGRTGWHQALWVSLTGCPKWEATRPRRVGELREWMSLAIQWLSRWMIDCPVRFGLYRLHQISRVLFWFAITAVGWNTMEWVRNTWVLVPKP